VNIDDDESAERGLAWDLVLDLPEQTGSSVLVDQRAAEDDPEHQPGTTLFIASTDAPDRAMDIVRQDWKLGHWRANPVILDNHNSMRVAGKGLSGKVPRVGDDAGKLMIRVAWDLENPDPSIRSVGHQHLNGFRRAGSVGFRHGKKTQRSKLAPESPFYQAPVEVETWWGGTVELSGFLFEANELLEFSSATIPMNAEALQRCLDGQHLHERLAEQDAADVQGRMSVVRQTVPRATGDDLASWLSEPEHREKALSLLWPDLLNKFRTDPSIRRIVAAYQDAGPTRRATNNREHAELIVRLAQLVQGE
jgi:hypothetical protein